MFDMKQLNADILAGVKIQKRTLEPFNDEISNFDFFLKN